MTYRIRGQRAKAMVTVIAAIVAMIGLVIAGGAMRSNAAPVAPASAVVTFDRSDNAFPGGQQKADSNGKITINGTTGYCMDVDRHMPANWKKREVTHYTYTRGGLAPTAVANCLGWGYPTTTTINGHRYNASDADFVTQYAIWMVMGTVSMEWPYKVTINGQTSYLRDWGAPSNKNLYYQMCRDAEKLARNAIARKTPVTTAYFYNPPAGTNWQRVAVVGAPDNEKVLVQKTSSNPDMTVGDAYHLSGAKYGLYWSDADAKADKNRVSTVTTADNGKSNVITLDAKHANKTIYAKELTAPANFQLNTQVFSVKLVAGKTVTIQAQDEGNGGPFSDTRKLDAQSMLGQPQGKGTLAGAEYTLSLLQSKTNRKVQLTWVFKTDEQGKLAFDDAHYVSSSTHLFHDKKDASKVVFPFGEYTLTETEAPTGYNLDKTVHEITLNAKTEQGNTDLHDSPIRGNLKFTKVSADDGHAMPNVAFIVTSKTTGEWHVIVTDANGKYDSSAVKHSVSTNANDAAVQKNEDGSYTVDETKLVQGAGTWFYGYDKYDQSQKEAYSKVKVDDSVGAFPYDDYEVQEVRTSATLNHELTKFSFSVTKDGSVNDAGTIKNDVIVIETSATDASDGDKYLADEKDITVNDEVNYKGLIPGVTYTMTGTIHKVAADGTDAGAIDGVTNSVTFTPDAADGTVTVPLKLDASQLGGYSLVVFERISQNGKDIATHEDITDKGQTVRVVHIGTMATDAADGDKYFNETDGTVTVNDEVSYSGLIPGEEYTMTGTIHRVNADGTDGGAIDGVTNSVTFTPKASSGKVTVPIQIDVSQLGGSSLVVFERVSQNGKDIAKHENPSDKDQTVHVVHIGTMATNADTGSKYIDDANNAVINDEVSYSGLVPGEQYTMTGTLHRVNSDGTDGGAIDGVTNSVTFTPKESAGKVAVPFKFDASQLGGSSVVAFEKVSQNGKDVAKHENPKDQDQTVSVVHIGTTATDATDGDHDVTVGKEVSINDDVQYAGLIPGHHYTMTGTLHQVGNDGSDAGVLKDASGKDVTASVDFVPETANGSVTVAFQFSLKGVKGLDGQKVVAFEDCYENGIRIATHENIKDESQTVTLHTPIAQTGDAMTKVGIAVVGAAIVAGVVVAIRRRMTR